MSKFWGQRKFLTYCSKAAFYYPEMLLMIPSIFLNGEMVTGRPRWSPSMNGQIGGMPLAPVKGEGTIYFNLDMGNGMESPFFQKFTIKRSGGTHGPQGSEALEWPNTDFKKHSKHTKCTPWIK